MKELVNKNQMSNAHHSKRFVKPALEALRKLDAQALSYDPYGLEKAAKFIVWLEGFEKKADDVISRADAQYKSRPQHLITAASIRFNSIHGDIELEQKTSQGKIEAHQTKSDDLRKQNFSESEIKIILPFPQEEIDAHADAIIGLQNEQKNLQNFLASAPAYNTNLLNMEKLAPYLQHHKTAE